MPVFRLDIDVTEQIVVHEAEVAFRMAARQTAIFIQIESLYFLEGNLTCPVAFDQILVGTLWCAAGGQPQGAAGFAAYQVCDDPAGGGTELVVVLDGDDLHALGSWAGGQR